MATSWQHKTGKHEHSTTRNDVKEELKEIVGNGKCLGILGYYEKS